jgi:pimeloyl-ACP methyl ester carboxylesterase
MKVTTLGIDPAKSIFRLHGVDTRGVAVLRRQLTRKQLLPFLAKLSPCLVGMEAGSGAHFWAREIGKLGRRAVLSQILIRPNCWWFERGGSTADCTDLGEGHSGSAQIFERFVGPGEEFSRVDPRVEFPKVSCPVLIASGAFDFAAVPTAWHKFKDLLANHSYRAFEKSGHYPHFEEQALFEATLLEWLKRN